MRPFTRLTIVVLLMATGCSMRLGDFTLMTTKNIGITPRPLASGVRGEDCIHQILGIPIGSLNPNLEEAIDNAVAKASGGNAMTDASIHQDIFTVLLYTRVCMRVDGAVVALHSGKSP